MQLKSEKSNLITKLWQRTDIWLTTYEAYNNRDKWWGTEWESNEIDSPESKEGQQLTLNCSLDQRWARM